MEREKKKKKEGRETRRLAAYILYIISKLISDDVLVLSTCYASLWLHLTSLSTLYWLLDTNLSSCVTIWLNRFPLFYLFCLLSHFRSSLVWKIFLKKKTFICIFIFTQHMHTHQMQKSWPFYPTLIVWYFQLVSGSLLSLSACDILLIFLLSI